MTLVDEVRAYHHLPAPAEARAIRRQAGVSQDRLAKELGVHRLTVIRWETGARSPTGIQRAEYATLLGQLREVVASVSA